jgi:hypothetical protein
VPGSGRSPVAEGVIRQTLLRVTARRGAAMPAGGRQQPRAARRGRRASGALIRVRSCERSWSSSVISTIRLTADTYGHVLPTRARAAADALDRAIGQVASMTVSRDLR